MQTVGKPHPHAPGDAAAAKVTCVDKSNVLTSMAYMRGIFDERAKLNADSILNAFAAAAKQVRGVARVDRMSAIRRADFAIDNIARRWSGPALGLPRHSAVAAMPVARLVLA